MSEQTTTKCPYGPSCGHMHCEGTLTEGCFDANGPFQYNNPDEEGPYEVGAGGVSFSHMHRRWVLHYCNGSMVVNPLEGPYTAEQFDMYIEPSLPIWGTQLRMAQWDVVEQQYKLLPSLRPPHPTKGKWQAPKGKQ